MIIFWALIIAVFFLLSGVPFIFWLILGIMGFSVILGIVLYCLGYRADNCRNAPDYTDITLDLLSDDTPDKKTHKGRCDGDCKNCPPHYGYRYGRWYYGHDHAHGCQFGGNRCGGGMD